jgi:hypothetical protein
MRLYPKAFGIFSAAILLAMSGCTSVGSADAKTVCRDSTSLVNMYPTDYPNEWLSFFDANSPNDSTLSGLQSDAVAAIRNYQSNASVANYGATLDAVAAWNNRCADIL